MVKYCNMYQHKYKNSNLCFYLAENNGLLLVRVTIVTINTITQQLEPQINKTEKYTLYIGFM